MLLSFTRFLLVCCGGGGRGLGKAFNKLGDLGSFTNFEPKNCMCHVLRTRPTSSCSRIFLSWTSRSKGMFRSEGESYHPGAEQLGLRCSIAERLGDKSGPRSCSS